MIPEQLEYEISQYLDGTLPPLQRQALEQRLADDPQARRLLEEYRTLDQALGALPAPQIEWGRLSEHLSQMIAQQPLPQKHYSLRWVRWASASAVAAAVLIASAVGIRMAMIDAPAGEPVMVVEGPAIEAPLGPAVENITIGPAHGAAEQLAQGNGVVTRPSRVIIASAYDPSRDRRNMPY